MPKVSKRLKQARLISMAKARAVQKEVRESCKIVASTARPETTAETSTEATREATQIPKPSTRSPTRLAVKTSLDGTAEVANTPLSGNNPEANNGARPTTAHGQETAGNGNPKLSCKYGTHPNFNKNAQMLMG